MKIETPPFDEGIASFRRFAESEGFSSDLVWIFREDVTACRWDYWVRVSSSSYNAELARRYYEFGRKQGFGVTIQLLYPVKGQSACCVRVPKDMEEAGCWMQGPLKLCVPSGTEYACPIYSDIAWRWRLFLNVWRPCIWIGCDWLPTRAEVARITAPETCP